MGEKLQRSCIACRTRGVKHKLLRLTKSASGDLLMDISFSKQGRGAYICKNIKCLELARKKRSFERALGCKLGPETFEKLASFLKISDAEEFVW